MSGRPTRSYCRERCSPLSWNGLAPGWWLSYRLGQTRASQPRATRAVSVSAPRDVRVTLGVQEGDLLNAAMSAWGQVGFATKLGFVSQAATCGLLLASVRRPSRPLTMAALAAAVVALAGLSLMGVFNIEYTVCGGVQRPEWCW